MRGTAATGWVLLIGGLALAASISIGLYQWDSGARAAEASLRPQPVAPLALPPPSPVPYPAAVVVSPQAAAGGDPANGQAAFQTKCNPCHPSASAGIGPALSGAAFTDRNPDNATIVAVIRSGRGVMPAFSSSSLSDDDLANIVAYLRSLPR